MIRVKSAEQGVARAEQRPLGLVEDRVAELDLVGRDARRRPAGRRGAMRPNALDIEALDPVASITTSGRWPSVSVAQILLECLATA